MPIWNLIYTFLCQVIAKLTGFVLNNGKKSVAMNNRSSIIVKFSSRPFVELQIDRKWTIKDLKETLSKKLDLPTENIKLIFAGKELHNDTCLEDYDLGQQSIIHAVPSLKSAVVVTTENFSHSACDESIFTTKKRAEVDECSNTESVNSTPKKKAGFFVYCNSCKSLQRGKLRVRCNICKQGTLTVNGDPCGWDDVLIPGKMSGVCQSENCEGSIAEFYFKCADHPSSEDETSIALYQVKCNNLEASCLSCMEVNDVILVFTCNDSHVLCIDCFILYCTSRLNERQFVQDLQLGYTLACPAGCENSLIKETHHFHLLGNELYSRYQLFGAEECLLQAGGVLCPVPGCGAGILPDPDCSRVVCSTQGQGCGFVFCKHCLQGYHLGECESAETLMAASAPLVFTINVSQVEMARKDSNHPAVQVMIKPCPRCRTPTERDGGCMHMVCTRTNCNFHWCWICQCAWSRECMGNHWFG